MDSSIKCKSKFNKEIEEFANLVAVNVSKWAGIGAVRYIPEYLSKQADEIRNFFSSQETPRTISDSDLEVVVLATEKEAKTKMSPEMQKSFCEINEINKELVKKLQTRDNAYAIGEDENGMVYIKFGMVNDLDAVKKLASEVQSFGREVSENTKVNKKKGRIWEGGVKRIYFVFKGFSI